MRPIRSLSLCTTVYPGVEAYLADWYQSLCGQTDRDVQVWIALDAVEEGAVKDHMGGDPGATWVAAQPGDTPSQVRQRVLSRMLGNCDGVVLVDSDDILHPDRIAAARLALQDNELAGCALRLVDHRGIDLGQTFSLPPGSDPVDVLPRHNVFGMSNTAWRSQLLARCLPLPASVEIVDWFLATRAWLLGATLGFDRTVHMDYRQHATNMTHIRPPFSRERVIRDTDRACRHFELICSVPLEGALEPRQNRLREVASDVGRFRAEIVRDERQLDTYVDALNSLDLPPLWWSSVAHPQLKHLWS